VRVELFGRAPDVDLLGRLEANRKMNGSQNGAMAAPVVYPLAVWLSEGTLIRFEPLRGGNLDIYLPSDRFQDIPYPDRDTVLKNVGAAWCSNNKKDAFERLVFLSSVRIRDVRSGDVLASRNCFLGGLGF